MLDIYIEAAQSSCTQFPNITANMRMSSHARLHFNQHFNLNFKKIKVDLKGLDDNKWSEK